MKILLTYEFPFHSHGYGGGQQIARGIATALSKLNHDVTIACQGIDELNLNEIDKPVKFIFFNKFSYRFSFIYSIFHSLNLLYKIKPDLVITFTSESSIIVPICRIIKIDCCTYIAPPFLPIFKICKPLVYLKNIRKHFSLFFLYIGTKFSKNNFIISNELKKQAIENWNISENLIKTVYCGISDIFFDANSQKNYKPKNDFITIGRISLNQKPIDQVIISLSQNQNLWSQYSIVGSGEDFNKIKLLINNLDLNYKINLLGTKDSNNIIHLINDHKIVILPSNYESFFITVFEALLLNKIVITNNVADIKEIFKDCDTLIIAEDNSINAYNKAIQLAIKKYNLINEFDYLKPSNIIISRFKWNLIVKEILNHLYPTI